MANNIDFSSSKPAIYDADMIDSAVDSVNSMYTASQDHNRISFTNNKVTDHGSSSATAAISSGAATRDSSPDLQGELGFERDQTVSFLQHGLQSYEQGFQAISYALELLKQLPPGVNITPEFIARAQEAEAYCQQLELANATIQRTELELRAANNKKCALTTTADDYANTIKERDAQISTLLVKNAELQQKNRALTADRIDLDEQLDESNRLSEGRREQHRQAKLINKRLNEQMTRVENERDHAKKDLKFFKQELASLQVELEDKKSEVRDEQNRNSMLKDENRWLNKKLDQINRIEKKAKKYYHFFLETIDVERSARKHEKRRAARISRSPLSAT